MLYKYTEIYTTFSAINLQIEKQGKLHLSLENMKPKETQIDRFVDH